MIDQQKVFVQIALNNWNLQISRADKVFNSYNDNDFFKEVAPNKNRIIYLYGHLAIYHDLLKETLGIGSSKYSSLVPIFLQHPDSPDAEMPSVGELKALWADVHNELNTLFINLPIEEWFKRHNAMTNADFEIDPTRNRLSVLINRGNHVAYHLGQVALLKPEID
ncbi:DinB family protein [Mucilaginibacter sp. X4EP1]|uniref:DinB family protein n=1 Tax=Mucilaginibacter sp. X4EP1 TaxID=2723092 RepID=UPI0021672357|nr:DinB family protein [Mucilaginibacter sp. X4EP1]MCS3813592.1 hypothetical protein [Mucilaginibacter sp. X4EP1]